MNLKEQLIQLKGKNIKVGSQGAFVFIGLCDDNIFNYINQVSKEELQRLHRRLNKYQKYLNNFDGIMKKNYQNRFINPALKEKFEKLKKENPQTKFLDVKLDPEALEQINKEFEEFKETRYIETTNGIEKTKNRIETHTNFLGREVKEVYPSTYTDEIIVIFEGKEDGLYWFVEEFNVHMLEWKDKKIFN